MADSPNLDITLLEENQAAPEVTVNEGTNILDGALTDLLSVDMDDSNQTILNQDALSTMFIELVDGTGAPTASRQVTLPVNEKLYFIKDSTTGGFDMTVIALAGTGFTLAKGAWNLMRCDGTDAELIKVLPGESTHKELAVTLTTTNKTLTSSEALEYSVFNVTGTLTGDRNLIFPADGNERVYYINNGVAGTPTNTYGMSAQVSGGSAVKLPQGWNVIRVKGTVTSVIYPKLTPNEDLALTITASNYTLTAFEVLNYNVITISGALTGDRDLIFPNSSPSTNEKIFTINNTDTSGYILTAKVSGQTGVRLLPGWNIIRINGTDAELVLPGKCTKWDVMVKPASANADDWEIGDTVLGVTSIGSSAASVPTRGELMKFQPDTAWDCAYMTAPNGTQDWMITMGLTYNSTAGTDTNYVGLFAGEADGVTNNLDAFMIRSKSDGKYYANVSTFTTQPIVLGTNPLDQEVSNSNADFFYLRVWYDYSAHDLTYLISSNGATWHLLHASTTPTKAVAPCTEVGLIGIGPDSNNFGLIHFWRVQEGADLSGNIYDSEGGVLYL